MGRRGPHVVDCLESHSRLLSQAVSEGFHDVSAPCRALRRHGGTVVDGGTPERLCSGGDAADPVDAKQVQKDGHAQKKLHTDGQDVKHPEAGSQKLVRHLFRTADLGSFTGPPEGIGGLGVPLEAQKGPQGRAAAGPLDQAKEKDNNCKKYR